MNEFELGVPLPYSVANQASQLHDVLATLTAEQRLEVVAILLDGYCRDCGRTDPEQRCRCWDDS